jgi:hypothetical protein
MELVLFLPEGMSPEDIIELIEKIIKYGDGSLEEIRKLIELLKLLGLTDLIIEINKLLVAGFLLLSILNMMLEYLKYMLDILFSTLQRFLRKKINLVFIYVNTNAYTNEGSPIYRVALIDSYDPNMILLKFILLFIPDHGFRIITVNNNLGVPITAIETDLEIAGELNSRFSSAPLWSDLIELEIYWRAWPAILRQAYIQNISISTGLLGNRTPITYYYTNGVNSRVVIKSNYGVLGPYNRQE